MGESSTPRAAMVDGLRASGAIRSVAVGDAFLAVPREHFLPGVELAAVYRDEPILTKTDEHGRPLSSSSQPAVMAWMLEALDLRPGLDVLEVGAGTGYNAALLAHLVRPGGRVTSVDIDPELAERAAAALRSGGHAAEVVVGDGRDGWADGAPYDRIILTASTAELSRSWLDQLVDGGLLQVPLQLSTTLNRQAIVTFRRAGSVLASTQVFPGGFMPLRPGQEQSYSHADQLSLTEVVDDAVGHHLSLGGAPLRKMSPRARARLLELLPTTPRRTRLAVASGDVLDAFLVTTVAEDRLLELVRFVPGAPRFTGLGLAERSGRGVAVLGPARGHVELLTLGARSPADQLLELLHDGTEQGATGLDRLRVTARFDERRPDRASRRRGDAWLRFAWGSA